MGVEVKALANLIDYGRATLPPTPRRVRVRGSGGVLWICFIRLFFLPHFGVGVVLPIVALGYVACALFGHEVEGRITHYIPAAPGSRKGMPQVEYLYEANGPRVHGQSHLTEAQYAVLIANQPIEGTAPIRVRYVRVGLFHAEVAPAYVGAWHEAGLYFLFAAFWDGVVGVFVYVVWIGPIRVRLLYRYGTETRGTIVALREIRGKSTSYQADYTFKDAQGVGHKSKMVVDAKLWKAASEGMAVRVLYSAQKPKRSVVYELGPYRSPDAEHGVGML